MNEKGETSKNDPAMEILIPLSGKKQPNAVDLEILMADRAMLEALAQSILQNKRLATLIAHAWLDRQDMVCAPREWLNGRAP